MRKKFYVAFILAFACLILPGAALAANVVIGDSSTNTVPLIQTAVQNAINSAIPPGGGVVIVTGDFLSANSPLTFNIPAGVTVYWDAALSGSLTSTSRYLLTLQGGGTFNLTGSIDASISNSNGAAVYVAGAGMTVEIQEGGALRSAAGSNGITLYIAADNVIAYIGLRGIINNGGSNSAVNVANNLTNVAIDVNGGTILSIPSGYAINDGGSINDPNSSNTVITVRNGGTVTAGTACAIRSTATGSTVTVTGGTVANAASNNANPTIYMNGGTGNNVIINGSSIVKSMSSTGNGFAVQTTGSVSVSGSAQVIALGPNGRAINLVGVNSVATIDDRAVIEATGTNGVAISTATTAGVDVTNASVIVNGGTISSVNGHAIQITGANSTLTVSGGTISADVGNAVYSTSTATNSSINVSGGTILATAPGSSTGGYAIRTSSTAAGTPFNAVNVTGGAVSATGAGGHAIHSINTGTINVSGGMVSSTYESSNSYAIQAGGWVTVVDSGQVWATLGRAIDAGERITVDNNGFVFAYGNSRLEVVSRSSFPPGNFGFVISWGPNRKSEYLHQDTNSREDILNNWAGSGTWHWYNHPIYGGGIQYVAGANQWDFFPISNVIVYRDYGLIFHVVGSGAGGVEHMFRDDSPGDGDYSGTEPRVFPGGGFTPWTEAPNVLTLNNFSWVTKNHYSLTVWNAAGNPVPATITLNGTSVVASLYTSGTSFGINNNSGTTLSIEGHGSLEVRGNTRAFSDPPIINIPAFIYWTNTDPWAPDPSTSAGRGTPVYPGITPNIDWNSRFVKISSAAFAIVDNVTISGTSGNQLTPQTATIRLYGDTQAAQIVVGADVYSWFGNLPSGVTVTVSNITGISVNDIVITLAFSGTPMEGFHAPFDITVIPGSSGAVTALPNPNAMFNIEGMFDLIVGAGEGGAVTVTALGDTIHGTYHEFHAVNDLINKRAVADSGYYFTGWTAIPASIASNANPTNFNMPAQTAIIFANFESRDTPCRPTGGGGCNTGVGAFAALALAVALWHGKRRQKNY